MQGSKAKQRTTSDFGEVLLPQVSTTFGKGTTRINRETGSGAPVTQQARSGIRFERVATIVEGQDLPYFGWRQTLCSCVHLRNRHKCSIARGRQVRSHDMTKTSTAKLFKCGANQMLRLPAKCQFESKESHITRYDATGDSGRGPESWRDLPALQRMADAPDDSMVDRPLNWISVHRSAF